MIQCVVSLVTWICINDVTSDTGCPKRLDTMYGCISRSEVKRISQILGVMLGYLRLVGMGAMFRRVR